MIFSTILISIFFLITIIYAEGESSSSCYDVIIIGGGISGLSTAKNIMNNDKKHNHNNKEEKKKILLLEARDRLGGRVFTANEYYGGITDLGASWVHGSKKGNRNPINEIFRKKLNVKYHHTNWDSLIIWDEENEEEIDSKIITNHAWDDFKYLLNQHRKTVDDLNTDISLESHFLQIDEDLYNDRYVQWHVSTLYSFCLFYNNNNNNYKYNINIA